MQIGIDARSLGPTPTGVGTYLSEILKYHPFSSGSTRNHLFCHRPPAFPPADNVTLHISKVTRGLPWYLFRAHQAINKCSQIFFGVLKICCPATFPNHFPLLSPSTTVSTRRVGAFLL